MEDLTLTCTTFTYGGQTLGRLPDGRAVFVPFALPGEQVRVRVVKAKAGYVEAELLTILEPAAARIGPRCRHFTTCGGCHYQHLSYADQLAVKSQILRDQLARLGGLVDPPLRPMVPSPQPWHYRNHMQFHRTDAGHLGLQAARSHQIVPIQECHLPEPALAAAWQAVGRQGDQQTRRPADRERISLRVGSDGTVQTEDGGPIRVQVLDRSFQVSPAAFFQVNTPMAEAMVTHVLAHLPLGPADQVVDVYCGVGLFSAFLAPRVQRLIGIESSPAALHDFQVNLGGMENVQLRPGLAEKVLPQLKGPVTSLLVDPPRAGLGPPVVDAILRLAPVHLVYVSCDPATLARDARQLVAGGYQVQQITPFDLFPQTYHIESISFWTKQR